MCDLCVLQEVVAEEEEGEVVMVSTAPEELRMQVLTQRSAAAPSRNSSLLATAGLNLPSRALVSILVGVFLGVSENTPAGRQLVAHG